MIERVKCTESLPAPAELDDDVVGLDGAEDALDVGDGLRGEVRRAEDPDLLGLHEVRRAPRRDRAEPPPRDAHERAGVDQRGQRRVARRRRRGARVGEHGRAVVEARRRRRDRRPERRRRGGWGRPRCHPGRSAALLAGGARAAARARARGGDETGPRDWAAAVRAFGTIEDKPTDPANGCLLSFFFSGQYKIFF